MAVSFNGGENTISYTDLLQSQVTNKLSLKVAPTCSTFIHTLNLIDNIIDYFMHG
jgi:hypothetical protein